MIEPSPPICILRHETEGETLKRHPQTRDTQHPSSPKSAAPSVPSDSPPVVAFDPRSADELSSLLAAIVASSDDAIISCTLGGSITSWNKGAEHIFGYTAAEIMGKPTSELGSPSVADDTSMVLKKIAMGDRIEHYETVRRHKDGSDIIVSLTVSPIRNAASQIIGISKVARDITQTRRAEEALRNADKLALVGRLSASIAHEINNPLESVTNLIYLLKQEKNFSPHVYHYLDLADSELSRVSHITAQTLGFFRGPSNLSLCQLSEIVQSALSLHAGRFMVAGVKVKTRYREAAPLLCYQGELRQVLVNLVSNAIDAMTSHGELTVRLRPASDTVTGESGVRLTIADNGIGMSTQTLNHIFEPFYTTKGATGTGLGLWVTQQIIARHKGRISVRSNQSLQQHGTIFSLFFPYVENNIAEKTAILSAKTRPRKDRTLTLREDASRHTPSQSGSPSVAYSVA